MLINGEAIKKVICYENTFVIRKPIDDNLNIENVIDKGIQSILKNRLDAFSGNKKLAFSNLEENPIYLDKNETNLFLKRKNLLFAKVFLPPKFLGLFKKKLQNQLKDHASNEEVTDGSSNCRFQWIPWSLLVISWVLIAIFFSIYFYSINREQKKYYKKICE